MALEIDQLSWQTHELKIRELFDKRYIESTKIVSEFSKMLIGNLILINAGGVGSITFFANEAHTVQLSINEKIQHLMPSATFFVIGLLSAILCGFSAYVNFSALATIALNHYNDELSIFRKQHIAYRDNPSYKALLDDAKKLSEVKVGQLDRWIEISKYAGIGFGFCSFGCFVAGCIMLVLKTAS